MLRRLAGGVILAAALMFCVLPVSLSPHPAQARSSDDDDSGKAERRARAKAVKEAAENGDIKAQEALGWMHAAGGYGVRHSYKEAAKWWTEAMNHGSARATFYMGELYQIGKGVDQDDAMAVKLFRQAADKNVAPAMASLGIAYLNGEGVAKNEKQGLDWLNKAAALNDSSALTHLGYMQLTGKGMAKDPKAGVQKIRTAAEMGHGSAMILLAAATLDGEGTDKNLVEALKWALLADDRDIKNADKLADEISGHLSASDRAEAKRLAAAWKPRKSGADDDEGGDISNSKGDDEDGSKSSSDKSAKGSASSSSSAGGYDGPLDKRRIIATGTGFVVSQEGHLVTNHHVIKGCARLDAGTALMGMNRVQVVADDPGNDLAVLKLPVTPKAVASFRSGQVRQAEGVMIFGFPLSGELASDGNITSGNITALAGLRDDSRYYQTSAPSQPGNSGGPMLDMSGNVVGILSMGLVGSNARDVPQNVNFAIKGSLATSFLESHGIPFNTAPLGDAKSPPDISDLAKKFTLLVTCSQ
jgi:TPR repeat protein